MSASVMISGSLFRSPIQKTAKSGKLYTTATLKSVAGTEVEYWTALVFGETEQAALLGLAVGEKVAVQGAMKLEAKASDGEVRIFKTIFVEALLALKPAPRERKPKAEKTERGASGLSNREADINDAIPF
jgi:hypothetical protein